MKRSFHINSYYSAEGALYDMHIHDTYEFNLIDSDDISVVFENSSFCASRGDFFIFPPFTFHKIEATGKEYKRHVSHFSSEKIIEAAPCVAPVFDYISNFNPFYVRFSNEQQIRIKELVATGTRAYISASKWEEFDLVFSICAIIKTAAEIHRSEKKYQHSGTSHTPHRVSKILKYVYDNYAYDLTVEHITKKFKISKSSLYSMFNDYLNMPFKEYIIRLRLAKAMELLKKGVSVTETANTVGFNSYAHFIRIFTQKIGISPKQYGKAISNNLPGDFLRMGNI